MSKRENMNSNHRSRLRDRLLSCGVESLAEHELLELLLFTPIRRRNTNAIAHRLIERFGSLFGVLDAPVEELAKVDGMGSVSARFIHDFGRAVDGITSDFEASLTTLSSPSDALTCAHRFFDQNPSAGAVYISLDGICRVITMSELPASPVARDLLTASLKYPSFGAVIAFRQSDSTRSKVPANSVIELFRQALSLMNIHLIDVLLVGDVDVSFYAHGHPPDTGYILPQDLDGAVVMHEDAPVGISYDDEPLPDPEPAHPFDGYDLADAIPAGSIAAELANNSAPSVEAETRHLIDAARRRNSQPRTRRGEPLSPELDALIGPHVDPNSLDDEAIAVFRAELSRQQKSE